MYCFLVVVLMNPFHLYSESQPTASTDLHNNIDNSYSCRVLRFVFLHALLSKSETHSVLELPVSVFIYLGVDPSLWSVVPSCSPIVNPSSPSLASGKPIFSWFNGRKWAPSHHTVSQSPESNAAWLKLTFNQIQMINTMFRECLEGESIRGIDHSINQLSRQPENYSCDNHGMVGIEPVSLA